MGITLASARFLTQSRAAGTRFGSVLTLGRQGMSIGPGRLREILDDCGVSLRKGSFAELESRLAAAKWPFEEFLTALGADEVLACDASDYEGAAVVHDLNVAVPEHLHERFDTVIDGGTLEHVFNFPVAIQSAMQMVKVGGRLFVMTPANNYFGHGFYQFSPELFYRVLSEENGFRVDRMVALVEDGGVSRLFGRPYYFRLTGPWYAVQDPQVIHKRVTLMNQLPVTLFVEATRTAAAPIFARPPQQSDYAVQWTAGEATNTAQLDAVHRGRGWSLPRVPDWVRWRVILPLLWLADPFRLVKWKRRNSFVNREFFHKIADRNGRRA